MSNNREFSFGRHAWAGAAIIIVAGLTAARAETPSDVHTPAVIRAAMPAAATPAIRLAPGQPLQRAVLRPGAASGTFPSPQSGEDKGGTLACRAPAEFTRLDHPLLRTAQRLASGEPLTIVAIGSSSTAGAGASSRAANYPSRLAVELKILFPRSVIKVLNRGVNGEDTPDMMARFRTGVIAEHPQLVLWQLGTNSVLRDQPLEPHALELRAGIEELKETGADLVLIDPQYAPRVLAKSETPGMVDQIALAAKDESVDLFPRFAVMRDWYVNQHRSFSVFVSPDGLHMNDWGYDCWAKLFAASIAAAANPPVASAAERSAP
jgi:acyl-CoA thioesterase-1